MEEMENFSREAIQQGEQEISVAEVYAQALADAGVTHVFGGHGGTVVPLINAIDLHPKLKWICMRNEHSASLAAAGVAKLTGKLACCLATSGPGASNLLTGMLDAMLDRVPVLVLTGTRARWDVGHTEFQDINQASIFQASGIAFSHTVMHSKESIPLLRNAIRFAVDNHCVTHLAIPVDIQAKKIPPPAPLPTFGIIGRSMFIPPYRPSIQCLPASNDLDEVAEVLRGNAKRIIICVGHRAAIEFGGNGASILALAETINAPVITTLDAKGVVDERHPLCFGVLGIFGNPGLEVARTIISSADLLLLFAVTLAGDFVLGPDKLQTRMVVTIEPDHSSTSMDVWFHSEKMLVGSLQSIADELTSRLGGIPGSPSLSPTDSFRGKVSRRCSVCAQETSYWDYIKKGTWKKKKIPQTNRLRYSPSDSRKQFCHPGDVLAQLSRYIKKDDVVVVDTGDITLWTSLCLCITEGARMLSSQAMGTMGYSIPAGIAAAMVRPTSKVFIIAGDGGAQMTLNELSLIAQYRVQNVILVISNNSLLGRIHFGFEAVRGDELIGPDYVKLAQSYGGDGIKITGSDTLEADIKHAISRAVAYENGLYVIEILVDPQLKADMAQMTEGGILGEISRPFAHKLWPGDLQRMQEALGLDLLPENSGMLSKEELSIAYEMLRQAFRDKEFLNTLLEVLHSGDFFDLPMHKPLLPPLVVPESQVIKVEKRKTGCVLRDLGSIGNIFSGTLHPQGVLSVPILASEYLVGFEVGTLRPGHAAGIGDMVLVNGTAYVSCPDEADPSFCHLVKGPTAYSTCALLLPKDATPDFVVNIPSDGVENMPWNRVINDVYAAVKHPFFFCGFVEYANLSGQALTRAPAYGEELLSNSKKYYNGKTDISGKEAYSFVCGISVCVPDTNGELKVQLSKHLYDVGKYESTVAAKPTTTPSAVGISSDPNLSKQESARPAPAKSDPKAKIMDFLRDFKIKVEQSQKSILTHTHGIVVKDDTITSIEALLPNSVERVIHVRGNSTCKRAKLDVYLIQSVQSFPGN